MTKTEHQDKPRDKTFKRYENIKLILSGEFDILKKNMSRMQLQRLIRMSDKFRLKDDHLELITDVNKFIPKSLPDLRKKLSDLHQENQLTINSTIKLAKDKIVNIGSQNLKEEVRKVLRDSAIRSNASPMELNSNKDQFLEHWPSVSSPESSDKEKYVHDFLLRILKHHDLPSQDPSELISFRQKSRKYCVIDDRVHLKKKPLIH